MRSSSITTTMSNPEGPSGSGVPLRLEDTEQEIPSDSVYSASGASETSPSEKEAFTTHRVNPKKRRIKKDSTALQGRVKRWKGLYNDEYRGLFNETVNEVTLGEIAKQESLPSSQIGATFWSTEDKELLFRTLARRGRHDLPRLAADIGSKSESEVFIYLEMLQKAAADEQIYEPKKKLPNAFDVPAALEISQTCCGSLDVAAEALSVLQQQEEEKIEKQMKKHGDLSLLTPKIAKLAERCLRSGEQSHAEILETLPAAELLNLRTFLALSKRFFMNSSVMKNNWRTYTERRKPPTIMYTAFSDFHKLALSVTNRIVQSSIFYAMSRRRALDASGHYTSSHHVKQADVLAALNTLGMEGNSRRIWAGVARKCKLRIYENVKRRRVSGKRYNYNEIEAIMTSVSSRVRGRSRANTQQDLDFSDSQGTETPDGDMSDRSNGTDLSDSLSIGEENSITLSDTAPSPTGSVDTHFSKQELREEAQDAYAEALDQQASRAEEQRFWVLLGEDVAKIMPPKVVELPRMPMAQRKDKEDLSDWKTWMTYVAEWEAYETPVSTTSFMENRSFGRRVEVAISPRGSDIDYKNAEDDVPTDSRSSRQSLSHRRPVSTESVCDDCLCECQGSESSEEDLSVRPRKKCESRLCQWR